MGTFIDLTGETYGYLTVISRESNDEHGNATWRCRCNKCGNEKVVRGNLLRNGHTKSCGCLHKEKAAERLTTHGQRYTKDYSLWQHIKDRCTNLNCKAYKNYGGRGITMYPAWLDDPQAFVDYVSTLEHYGEPGYSLDRINNNGSYEPGNLRFADRKTQARNTRQNVMVEYEGEQMCLTDAAELSGINYGTLRSRYKKGDRGDKLFRPVRK